MIESKYLIFYIGSAVCVPAGILAASASRRIHDAVFVALVFGTTQPASLFGRPTDINFYSRDWYRGSTMGIEISYLDLLAIILLISTLIVRRREGLRLFWPPSMGVLLLYFLWCCLNVAAFSDPKLFGVFECTKVARALVLFTAVALYVRRPLQVRLFVYALAIAVLYESSVCVVDRYIYGQHRISGTLGHPNSLSMYSLLCVPIFISTFFAQDITQRLRAVCAVATLGAAGCVLLSISRMGVVSLLVVSSLAFLLSTGLRLSPRNVTIAALGLVVILLMFVKSWDSFSDRMSGTSLQQEYLTEEGDRGTYFRQGIPAILANPLAGVGLNNWSYWITNRYAAEAGYTRWDGFPITPYEGTGIPPRAPQQVAPAHNYFLLTTGELGLPGLLLTLALFARWLWISGQVLWVRNRTFLACVRIGIILSLCGLLLQSWTEWEFRQTPQFFLGHIIMAVGAVLYLHRTGQSSQ